MILEGINYVEIIDKICVREFENEEIRYNNRKEKVENRIAKIIKEYNRVEDKSLEAKQMVDCCEKLEKWLIEEINEDWNEHKIYIQQKANLMKMIAEADKALKKNGVTEELRESLKVCIDNKKKNPAKKIFVRTDNKYKSSSKGMEDKFNHRKYILGLGNKNEFVSENAKRNLNQLRINYCRLDNTWRIQERRKIREAINCMRDIVSSFEKNNSKWHRKTEEIIKEIKEYFSYNKLIANEFTRVSDNEQVDGKDSCPSWKKWIEEEKARKRKAVSEKTINETVCGGINVGRGGVEPIRQ